MKMASNQKMQENELALKVNFTQECRWPVLIFSNFIRLDQIHRALLHTVNMLHRGDMPLWKEMSPAQFWKLHLTGLHLGLHVCHRTCNMMLGLTVKLRRLPELIISKWLSTALPPYQLIPGWIVMFCKTKTPKLNSMRRNLQVIKIWANKYLFILCSSITSSRVPGG